MRPGQFADARVVLDGTINKSDAHCASGFPHQMVPIGGRMYPTDVLDQRPQVEIIALGLDLRQAARRVLTVAGRFDRVIGPGPIRDHTDPQVAVVPTPLARIEHTDVRAGDRGGKALSSDRNGTRSR